VLVTKIKAFKMAEVEEGAVNGEGSIKTATTKVKVYYTTCAFTALHAIPCTAV